MHRPPDQWSLYQIKPLGSTPSAITWATMDKPTQASHALIVCLDRTSSCLEAQSLFESH